MTLIKKAVADLLAAALESAEEGGELSLAAKPEIVVERPQNPKHGDFATSLPLKLARAANTPPMDIAKTLISLLPSSPVFEKISPEAPGFINFTFNSQWLCQQVENILSQQQDYGQLDLGQGKTVQIEFVSVNPTGPIHIGHARGAVIGSVLANILAKAGYQVTREYYINDAGAQMDLFADSVYARYKNLHGAEEEVPEHGYQGSYITDLAKAISAEHHKELSAMTKDDLTKALKSIGITKMLQLIKEDLASIGVTFDVWFKETSLIQSGTYDKVMDLLKTQRYLTKRDGATWFASSELGEDKDNVLIRSTGLPTYFATDIAYHYDKFMLRKFSKVINIWGADHHGHISRMKTVVGALGANPDDLTIMLTQMVALKKSDAFLKASKRSGNLVELSELVNEVGSDVCRYFFLARTAQSHMDFDLDLAKDQSANNPVYYLQYAHARMAGILRTADTNSINWSNGDPSLLNNPFEIKLMRKMVLFPDLIEAASTTMETHQIPIFATELATEFHLFYQNCQVVTQDKADAEISKARLKLVAAAKSILANCLQLMSISAPEKM